MSRDAVDEIFLTMEQILEQFRNMNPMVLYDLEKFHYKAYQKFLRHKNDFLIRSFPEISKGGSGRNCTGQKSNIDVMSRFRLESMMFPFNIRIVSPRKYNLADVTQGIDRALCLWTSNS